MGLFKKLFFIISLIHRNVKFPLGLIFHNGKIIIGDWTTIGRGFWFDGNVQIGTHCAIGLDVKLISTSHDLSIHFVNYRFNKHRGVNNLIDSHIIIGNNCWIGSNAIILPGVILGDNCVVGAGSVVTRSYPDNSIVVGAPAKLIKSRST